MKYNIDLNDNDYIEFNYSYLKHSKIGKYSLLATRISFPIAMFVFVLALLIIKIEIGLVISVAAVAVLWWFIVPVLMRRNIKKDIMKMKSDGKLLYHEKASVEFLDDRIVETCEQGETVVKYSDIVNVYEEKGYIYIFYGAMQAFILPERCFGDNEIREIKNKLSQSGVRA